MSLGGLLAQATLGGAAGVGKGIGDRIRADAQLKRQELLAEKQTTETMKRQTHNSGLRRDENTQQHGMTLAQQDAQNQNERGRIELTDELGQKNYTDERNDNGDLIGQRDAQSNQYLPFDNSNDSGKATRFGAGLSKEDWTRLKYVHETKTDRAKELRERNAEATNPLSQKEVEELATLNGELAQLEQTIYGGGNGTPLGNLLNGAGGDQGGGEVAPPPKPTNLKEEVRQEEGLREVRSKEKDQSETISLVQSDADKALQGLTTRRPTTGLMGRPAFDVVARAQEALARVYEVTADEKAYNALSDRERTQLKSVALRLEAKLREGGQNKPPTPASR